MCDYEQEQTKLGRIIDEIKLVNDMFVLSVVNEHWEARMKELAAKILKPGSDDPIEEFDGGLSALDAIWNLGGDREISPGQVYHRSAVDYYLGRKVVHVWGDGVLVRFVREDEPMLDVDKKEFKKGLWMSDELCNRGYKHGIALEYPCECGKVKYRMFAIPGVHRGGFAYLIMEGNPNLLDARNQCMVCDECEAALANQLEAIEEDQWLNRYNFDEDDDIIHP